MLAQGLTKLSSVYTVHTAAPAGFWTPVLRTHCLAQVVPATEKLDPTHGELDNELMSRIYCVAESWSHLVGLVQVGCELIEQNCGPAIGPRRLETLLQTHQKQSPAERQTLTVLRRRSPFTNMRTNVSNMCIPVLVLPSGFRSSCIVPTRGNARSLP